MDYKRQQRYHARRRTWGVCKRCPQPTIINPHTGRYYQYCLACRRAGRR